MNGTCDALTSVNLFDTKLSEKNIKFQKAGKRKSLQCIRKNITLDAVSTRMTSHLKGTLVKMQERPVQNLENDLIYKFVHLQISNDYSDNIYAIKVRFVLNFPFWFTLPRKRRKGLAHDYNIFATDTDCQTQNGSTQLCFCDFLFLIYV